MSRVPLRLLMNFRFQPILSLPIRKKNRAIRTPKLASSAHRWRWGWALEASCKAEIYFIRMDWNEEFTSTTWG